MGSGKSREQLQKENDELKLELIARFGELQTALEKNDELKANIELLKIAVKAKRSVDKATIEYVNRAKAQVEEETIERCAEIIDDCDANLTRWEVRQLINNQVRKYKEKSDG